MGADGRRKLYVFGGLVALMSLTSALLLAIRPAPLSPDSSRSLLATDKPNAIDQIFDTKAPVPGQRWKYIFIHHSQTNSGNAATLAEAVTGPVPVGEAGPPDHFVIGNGDGCADGEIQIAQRWNQQQPAGRGIGIDRMDPTCISVCMVGDFDHNFPTPTQMRSLEMLVDVLQRRLRIDHDHIWVVEAKESPAGIGRYFPRGAFREQLLP